MTMSVTSSVPQAAFPNDVTAGATSNAQSNNPSLSLTKASSFEASSTKSDVYDKVGLAHEQQMPPGWERIPLGPKGKEISKGMDAGNPESFMAFQAYVQEGKYD